MSIGARRFNNPVACQRHTVCERRQSNMCCNNKPAASSTQCVREVEGHCVADVSAPEEGFAMHCSNLGSLMSNGNGLPEWSRCFCNP